MKTKTLWTKTLALLMTVAMLMSTMVLTLPVTAEAEPIRLSLKRVNDADVVIDGYANDDVWTEIPSNSFAEYWGTFPADKYSYKAAWGTDSTGAAYVYFLIETTDTNKKASTVYLDKTFAKDANWLNGNMGINQAHKVAMTTGTEKCVAEYRMALSPLNITADNAVNATALLNVKVTPNSGSEGTINGKDPGKEAVSFILTDEKISPYDLKRVEDYEIDIDGQADDEAWSKVPFRSFKKTSGSTIDVDKYSYKILWGTDKDTNKSYVYLLVVTTDPNPTGTSVWSGWAFKSDSKWDGRTGNTAQVHNWTLSPEGVTTSVVEYRIHLDTETVGSTYGINIEVKNGASQAATFNGAAVFSPVTFTLTDSKIITEKTERDLKRVNDGQIKIDGQANDEVWEKVSPRTFKKVGANDLAVEKYSYKMLWGTDATDKAYLYILVETTDANAKGVSIRKGSEFQTDINWTTATGNMIQVHNWAQSKTDNGYIAEFRIHLAEGDSVNSVVGYNVEVKNTGDKPATFNGAGVSVASTTFKLTNERIEIERTVTLINNDTDEIIRTDTAIQGAEYTLPTTVEMEKTFLGWLAEGTLYPAGAKIVVTENMSVRAISIGLEMEKGAAVRLTQTTGMRWITYLDNANIPMGVEILSQGTLIVPADYLTEGVAFTHAGLETAGREANKANGYLDIVATEYVPDGSKHDNRGDRKQFNGSILNIQEGNYERDFVAVGYVKVQYSNGIEAYIYADYTECVRNVKEIAEAALADETATFNTAETAVLKKFAGQA